MAQYDYFSGKKEYKIFLKENKTIKVNIISFEGILTIDINNSTQSFYQGNIDKNFDFTINLTNGNYIVNLSSSYHKGSYNFSW